MDKGEIDLMVDMAVSPEREDEYDFTSETALLSWGVLYSRGGLEINSFSDLEGKKIAIMKSGILYSGKYGLKEILENFNIKAELIDVKIYADVFQLLDNNEADVGLVNWFFGMASENDYKVDRTGIMFQPSELKYALPKNASKNSYLIGLLDFDLKELKQDKNSIYHVSISSNFEGLSQQIEVVPGWINLFFVFIGVGAILVGLIFVLMRQYQKILKKRIDAKVEELLKSEGRYKDIYDSSRDGLISINPKGFKFIGGNIAAIKLLSMSDEEELKLKGVLDVSPTHQPDGQTSSEKAKQIIEKVNEMGSYLFEWEFKKKDGKTFPGMVMLSKMLSDNDFYLQANIRDITERKEAEKKVAELNMLRNQVITIVAHQLRTPLTGIRWSLERLLDGNSGKLEQLQRSLLENASNLEFEIRERINDMFETLDMEEGRIIFTKENFEVDKLLKSITPVLQQACEKKQLIINIDIEKDTSYNVNADTKKIRKVFEHVIYNAISYSKVKGKIEVKLSKSENMIKLEVSDNGIGIPAEEQHNLFTRFFRGSNAYVMKPDASGLGLTISNYYVKQHGGKISFKSTEGKGSTFLVELPAEK